MKQIHQPVAIITGAAGGIGRAIARVLSAKGYQIGLSDINQLGLEQIADELGQDHFLLPCDITDRAQVREMVQQTVDRTGRIDVLVNSAGMVITEPFGECGIEDLIRENELNYLAALYCIKEALPHMKSAGRGSIISIASLAGILPLAISPGYTASKSALRGLMLSLHMALKDQGIHVGCVCPSAVDTPMLYQEAISGGSNLNFLQVPLRPETVAKATWQIIQKNKAEVCLPWHEGVSCKFGGFFPWILPKILPLLEKFGERKRIKYIQQKDLNQKERSTE